MDLIFTGVTFRGYHDQYYILNQNETGKLIKSIFFIYIFLQISLPPPLKRVQLGNIEILKSNKTFEKFRKNSWVINLTVAKQYQLGTKKDFKNSYLCFKCTFNCTEKISFCDIFDSSEKKARKSESLDIKFDLEFVKQLKTFSKLAI